MCMASWSPLRPIAHLHNGLIPSPPPLPSFSVLTSGYSLKGGMYTPFCGYPSDILDTGLSLLAQPCFVPVPSAHTIFPYFTLTTCVVFP